MYKISAILKHDADVRAISIIDNDNVITGSRDAFVRHWQRSGNSWSCIQTFMGHTHYVSAVLAYAPDLGLPHTILSGSNDAEIRKWNLFEPTSEFVLAGHQSTVSCFCHIGGNRFASGSWDHLITIWEDDQPIQLLKGHQSAVWDIIAIDANHVLSASADKTIVLWDIKEGKQVKQFIGHEDCVRGLFYYGDRTFASVSNDETLRLWNLDDEHDAGLVLSDHQSFVYSVSGIPQSMLVSASEDWTIKVWLEGECIQSLQHPCSLWCVGMAPNGDIYAGGSDGLLYVWTSNDGLIMEEKERIAFSTYVEKAVAEKEKSKGVDIRQFPGPEALQVPGSRDGENKMVRENGKGMAYSWNSQEGQWVLVGEVVVEPSESVFQAQVDVGEGDFRTLRYVRGTDVDAYAESFLQKEGLQPSFKPQVVEFIHKNAGPIEIEEKPMEPVYMEIPVQHKQATFGSTRIDRIYATLLKFNAEVESLSEEEIKLLQGIVTVLEDTHKYHVSTFPAGTSALLKKLLAWPLSQQFPVFDLIRVIALHAEGKQMMVEMGEELIVLTMRSIVEGEFKNKLVCTRLLVNMLNIEGLLPIIVSMSANMGEVFGQELQASSTPLWHAAFIFLCYNMSLALLGEGSVESHICWMDVAALAIETYHKDTSPLDEDLLYLLCGSIANLAWNHEESRKYASQRNVLLSFPSNVPRIKLLRQDLHRYLST